MLFRKDFIPVRFCHRYRPSANDYTIYSWIVQELIVFNALKISYI